MQAPLSCREVCSSPPGLAPISSQPLFPPLRPDAPSESQEGTGRFPAGGSQPRCSLGHGGTCHKAPARGDAGRLPRSPRPPPPHARHPWASPAARPRVWRWHPKVAGGGWAPDPVGFAARRCQPGWGASPKRGPLGRYQEKCWQPALARGQAREGGCPPAPRGREQSPGISFLAGPGCPPSVPPVLLPRSGARIQLNQCSANNLPANKTFSSLSLLPPTPPQSVCDGSALI